MTVRTFALASIFAGASAFTTTTLSHDTHDDTLVYLPDGYDSAKTYPVLYFLHGRGQEEAGLTNTFLPGKPGLRFEQSLDDVPEWSYEALSGLKFTNLIDERQYILVAPLANRIDPDITCLGSSCRNWNSDSIFRFRTEEGFPPVSFFDDPVCADAPLACDDNEAIVSTVLAPTISAIIQRPVEDITCPVLTQLVGQLVPGADCGTDLGAFDLGPPGFTLASVCPNSCDACPTRECSNDEDFLVDLVATVQETFNTDPLRTHISGFSSGAFMSYQMACRHADIFASVFAFGGPQDLSDFGVCEPSEPVSIVHAHATFDFTVPFDTAIPTFLKNGATNGCGDVSAALAAPVDVLDLWTSNQLASIADLKTRYGLPDGTALDLYDDVSLQFTFPAIPGPETAVFAAGSCPSGITQELWVIEGGGHQPRVNDAFPSEVFNFLDAQSKPFALPYAQCGGEVKKQPYTGPTRCATGFECVEYSEYFSQCQRA